MKGKHPVPAPPRRRRRGQALVELGLCLPLLVIILIGIIDMGYLLWKDHTITAAIREGGVLAARLADSSTTFTNDNLENVTRNYILGVTQGTNLVGTEIVINPNDTLDGHDAIRITVSHNHRFFTPFNFTGAQTFPLNRSYICAYIGNTPPAFY